MRCDSASRGETLCREFPPYRRCTMRRPISAERMSSIDPIYTTEDTAIS
jgi:hypothetical protein